MTRIIKQSIVWIIGSLFLFLSLAEAKSIIIDVGHTKEKPGVFSATGEPEIIYNNMFAMALYNKLTLNDEHTVRSVKNLSLKERVEIFNSSDADLIISIHHDSTQPKYLGTNKYAGFSIFVYDDKSLPFAMKMGEELVKAGFSPSLHHAEDIKGERKELLSPEYGVYRANFYILKHTNKPIVLFEVGVITNQKENERVKTWYSIDKMTQCIVKTIEKW